MPVSYKPLSLSDTETESQHLNISLHHLFCSNWIHNQASGGLAETDNLVILWYIYSEISFILNDQQPIVFDSLFVSNKLSVRLFML